MKQIRVFIGVSLFVVLFTGIPLLTYALDIQEISVRGNTVIPTSTILSQIDSKVGLPYNPKVVTEDIQKIYNLGFFSAIEVDVKDVADGVQVTFILEERPFITNIEFQGNKKIKDEELEEVLTLAPSDLSEPFKLKFYPAKIKEDIENLKQHYYEKGFHHVQISSALIPDPSDPQENVLLQYTITENKKVQVRAVNFKGNAVLSEDQLRKAMQTRKKGFFSFITGSGKYEENTFETDLERIRFLYADHGYIDARVTDYSLDFRDKTGDLYITITVAEGELYTINTVEIDGNTVYSTEELQKIIKVAPPDPFSRSKIRTDIVAIADLYGQKGYLTPISEKTEGKLLIDPRIRIDREERHVNLVYSLREGVPHFFNRIRIAGNKRTRDKVIRRELKVQEGEPYDKKALKRSRQRVFNLGLFDEVAFNLSDGIEAKTVDLDIEVTEGSRGSFNFGGGWSSLDNWVVSGGVTTPNLFGLAHILDFSATLGGTSQTFNLSYTMPRFMDSQYSVGFDAYNVNREYSLYDSRSTGGGIRFGRRLSDNISGTVKYRYEVVDITNVDEDASARIQEAEGLSKTSSVSLILKRSTLNNVLLPTQDMYTKLSGEVAGGLLQGENDFYKVILDHNLYFPVIKDTPIIKDVALKLRGEFGYVEEFGESEKVPIFERFFGGGMYTIRGYDERSIGPEDENGEVIGGNKRIVLTSELIIPVKKELKLVTFLDTGDVYSLDEAIDLSTFRTGAGVGMRLFTPFGLLRLDCGWKIGRKEGESAYEIHFGMGTMF